MSGILKNLTRAALAVVVSPIDLVADVATLPASGYDGKHPFHRTKKRLGQAADAVDEALSTGDDE